MGLTYRFIVVYVFIAFFRIACAESVYPANPAYTDDAYFISNSGISRVDRETLGIEWMALSGFNTMEPTVTQHTVLVGSSSGLFALDILSGEILWHVRSETTLYSPTVQNEVAFVSGEDGSLRAFEINTGSIIWHQQFDGWTYPPAIASDRLIVGGSSRILKALDIKSGKILWRKKLDQELVYRPVAVESGHVALTTFSGETLLIEAEKGNEIWRIKDRVPSFSPAVGDRLGLFGTMDGRLRGITLNEGRLNWEYYLGGRLVFQPYETDGIVTVANDQGDIAVLQTSTGELLWHKKLARDLIGSPILRDGNIISFYSVRGMPSWSTYIYKSR